MNPVTVILVLFALTTALSLGAVYVKIPYPTAMVIAGVLIGVADYLMPGMGRLSIPLDPEILFTAILPPLLYAAAWYMSWNGFRANLRAIMFLAIGAVGFTTVGIAVIVMWICPGFTWPVAFALGAIVSPPDAVAVAAVTQRLRVPKRITTVLEGESLVNDASALVIYRFALAAAMGGVFSLSHALVQFPIVAGGGVVVGLVLAWVMHQIHERIEQPLIETAMTVLTPYAAYLFAEHLGTLGVLAVVTCGLVLSRHSSHLFSPTTRLTAVSFWNFLTFMLNGLVCILIGLQLPTILRLLETSFLHALGYAGIVCVAIVVLRIVWVIPVAYLPRLLPSIRKAERRPPMNQVLLVGWVGMRGVVSLAAALALPEKLEDGTAFPARDLILFLTFGVILATLVGQSLTLPWVIRMLRIEMPEEEGCEEMEARRLALTAALGSIEKEKESHATGILRGLYQHRLEHLLDCREKGAGPDAETVLQRVTIKAQRETLVGLRDKGRITDELLHKLERELDLEESRLLE